MLATACARAWAAPGASATQVPTLPSPLPQPRETVEAAQALTIGQQPLLLAFLGLKRFDLRQLVLQQVKLALACLGQIAQTVKLVLKAPHNLMSHGVSLNRAACSGPQKPSRICSWAADKVSLRCSC